MKPNLQTLFVTCPCDSINIRKVVLEHTTALLGCHCHGADVCTHNLTGVGGAGQMFSKFSSVMAAGILFLFHFPPHLFLFSLSLPHSSSCFSFPGYALIILGRTCLQMTSPFHRQARRNRCNLKLWLRHFLITTIKRNVVLIIYMLNWMFANKTHFKRYSSVAVVEGELSPRDSVYHSQFHL